MQILGLDQVNVLLPNSLAGAGSVQIEFGRIPDAELEEFSDPELDDTVLGDNTDLGAGGDGH